MDKKIYLSGFSEKSSKEIARIFKKCEDFEKKYKKDVSEFSKSEARVLIEAQGFTEETTLRAFLSTLRAYTKWCGSDGGFLSLKTEDFEKNLVENIHREFIETEDDLVDIITELYPLKAGNLVPPTSILLWYGVKLSEMPKLMDFQVNLESRRVYDSVGEPISGVFSDKALDILQKYTECEGFEDFRKDTKNPRFFKRMISHNSKIEGKELNNMSFSRQMQQATEKCIEFFCVGYLRPGNIYRSGRYRRLLELEKSGIDITSPENRGICESVFRHNKRYFDILAMYKLYRRAFQDV